MDQPIVSIDDYERIARAKLPPEIYDYYAGGSGREWTVRANLEAFDRWVLGPRVLVGVAERDTRPAVWGLAAAGADGVADVLEILREEFDLAMALAGCRSVNEIGPSLVRPAP